MTGLEKFPVGYVSVTLTTKHHMASKYFTITK